jgi:3-hydroxyacyl-CoA dehydrogenase
LVCICFHGNILILGQKNGSGFYKYEKRAAVPDPVALKPHIEAAKKAAGNPANIELSDQEIVEFILYSVANEAWRILSEGMVVRGSDIDIGAIYGYGFPSYRGGPLKWAEQEGYKKVAVKLNYWYQKYNLPVLQPCPHLQKLANIQ